MNYVSLASVPQPALAQPVLLASGLRKTPLPEIQEGACFLEVSTFVRGTPVHVPSREEEARQTEGTAATFVCPSLFPAAASTSALAEDRDVGASKCR